MIERIRASLRQHSNVAPLVFAACCLLSGVRMVKDAPLPGRVNRDAVAKRSDRRFSSLKAALPDRGIVGYIGEPGIPGEADYYLAQYALAPLVLDASPNHGYVVGNFPKSLPETHPQDLQLVRDFGDGVVLFARKDGK